MEPRLRGHSGSAFTNYFAFERTDVYQLAVSVNRRVCALRWPTGRSHLKDQAIRAADSIVLNTAEGWGRGRGNAARNHFRIAKGSAGETFAALDLIDADPDLRHDLQRLGAMLTRLAR